MTKKVYSRYIPGISQVYELNGHISGIYLVYTQDFQCMEIPDGYGKVSDVRKSSKSSNTRFTRFTEFTDISKPIFHYNTIITNVIMANRVSLIPIITPL